MSQSIQYARFASPIGELLLAARGDRLCRLNMLDGPSDRRLPEGSEEGRSAFLDDVRAQLDAYFAGRSRSFGLLLSQEGTPFQVQVWTELARIPYGETISYAELARRVGSPKASRAVGGANGRNPIAVVVPCHRVIAADGRLGGFGGGCDRKLWLLQHEAQVAGREVPASWFSRENSRATSRADVVSP
ncbi:methylated-DNA--[protein]-cysteine S-methyltransferase [Planctomyces sp. SH-PL62]|uniref:methylated-DNA--[protein]-cysteine S-methyltransferase n=1 Tax=Planctomyces sp. SH-PL62 TaxID=1636152 RepID=UPI00078E7FA6|nr:methylated-DNA--[protein]-cysteine S-methyltransferase [Planctomyces sp. SH-PL62]AMV36249.1 Methylated-DNA--protein-cysteine methyltransferase [Planctomyces sp. SH-PL62]